MPSSWVDKLDKVNSNTIKVLIHLNWCCVLLLYICYLKEFNKFAADQGKTLAMWKNLKYRVTISALCDHVDT